MKKLIVLLMALVIFFVPFGSAFAYTGGLLHGKQLNVGPSHDVRTSSTTTVTDGNEGSSHIMGVSGSASDTLSYEFAEPVNLTAYQLSATGGVTIRVLYADGTLQNAVTSPNVDGTKTGLIRSNVKKIIIENLASTSVIIKEFDVFGSAGTPDYSGGFLDGKSLNRGTDYTVSNQTYGTLTDNNTGTVVSLQANGLEDTFWYEFPSPVTLDQYIVSGDVTGIQLVLFNSSGTSIGTFNLAANVKTSIALTSDVKKVALINTSSSPRSLSEFNVFGKKTYGDLTNLVLSATHNSVGLMWNLPSDKTDFTGTKIYKNGEFLKSVDSSTKTFTDSNVSADTNYTYKITAVYSDGHETEGISKSVTTKSTPPPDRDGDGIPDDEDEFPDDPTNTPPPVEVGEVKNLEITTTYKSANLSWVLPKSENLQHVNIYRETLTQETSFMDKLINGKTVYAAGEKIFETNGTYFNDYTVEPGTEYEYKVTTTSVDGVESEGVTGRTKTPGKPLIDFEEVSLPFSVKDLLLSGNGLLWIIGPFILLALAFLLVPKLRNLILGAFRKDSKGSSEAAERRTKAEAIQKMERQEAKEFRTARETKSERVEVAPKPTREPKEIKQPRIREPKEHIRTAKLTRERIREPRAPRASREPRAPRERTRKPRDRRGIS